MVKKHQSRAALRETLTGYAFLFPMLINMLVFLIFPILFSLIMSFTKWDFVQGLETMKFTGLENFFRIFKDEWFTASLKNTVIFTIWTVPVGTALALIIAVIINKYVYFPNFHKISLFLPYISSIIASAVVWAVILHPTFGPVNELLKSLGVQNPPKWFGDLKWSLPSVIIFSIWRELGYLTLVYMAGLKGIPKELYEAAEIDGASNIQKFIHITMPSVSPTTFFLLITGTIDSFKIFAQVDVITQGGPGGSTMVVIYYMYKRAFQFYEMGYAGAITWLFFIMVFTVTIIQWIGQKKWVKYDI